MPDMSRLEERQAAMRERMALNETPVLRAHSVDKAALRRMSKPICHPRANVVETGNPKRHSQKPESFHALIEKVLPAPRIELFAREKRLGWHSWGNEVESDIELASLA